MSVNSGGDFSYGLSLNKEEQKQTLEEARLNHAHN